MVQEAASTLPNTAIRVIAGKEVEAAGLGGIWG